MEVETRVAVLETKMQFIEAETKAQTEMLKEQEKRMRRIEKVIYVAIGVMATLEFAARLAIALNHK